MPTPDEIRRWSEELARDPSSLVFLQLGEALRRQRQLDVALKIALRGLERHSHNAEAHDLLARIAVDRGEFQRAFDEWDMVLRLAPDHLGAMKGMGYVCYQLGMRADAERHLRAVLELGYDAEVAAALRNLERGGAADGLHSDAPGTPGDVTDPDDPRRLFADLIGDHEQTALLLDRDGLVLAGMYVDADGNDVSPEVGAELNGVSDEAQRAVRHLDIGEWRAIVVETEVATVEMLPAPDDHLVVLASARAMPLGLVRRLGERCAERARAWLAGRA